jgi:hypothetical protein
MENDMTRKDKKEKPLQKTFDFQSKINGQKSGKHG